MRKFHLFLHIIFDAFRAFKFKVNRYLKIIFICNNKINIKLSEEMAIEYKAEINRLWKEIFGDSDEYLDIVFDERRKGIFALVAIDSSRDYITSKYLMYSELVAGLFAMPYCFSDKFGHNCNGLYLFGLMTKPAYRRLGIMSGMMERINCLSHKWGYDFDFLIPAQDSLRDYYSRFGYLDSGEYLQGTINRDMLDNLLIQSDLGSIGRIVDCSGISDEIWSEIKLYLEKKEVNNSNLILLHGHDEWDIVRLENGLAGGKIFSSFGEDGVCNGVLFCVPREQSGTWEVVTFYSDDLAVFLNLLKTVFSSERVLKLKVRFIPGNDEYEFKNLFSEIESKKYGMIRINEFHENLDFASNMSCRSEYPILTNPVRSNDFLEQKEVESNREVVLRSCRVVAPDRLVFVGNNDCDFMKCHERENKDGAYILKMDSAINRDVYISLMLD